MKKISSTIFCAMLSIAAFAQTRHDVAVSSNVFTPAALTINAGDTVVWTNAGGTHNVNGSLATFPSNPAGFSNGAASSALWTFSHVFTTAGTYQYQCDPHASLGMTGSITVNGPALLISGIVDGPLSGGTKVLELYAYGDIADLSSYQLGIYPNGNTSPNTVFTLPSVALSNGSFYYVSTDSANMITFFGFPPNAKSSVANFNGDDAMQLSFNGSPLDVFGEIGVDGTGTGWDMLDGWAYRKSGTGPDGSTFVLDNWTYSGVDALDGETTNATSAVPFPIGTYTRQAAANPVVSFATASASIAENGGSITISVNISSPNANATSVNVSQSGGTATNGTDFSFNPSTLTFPASSSDPLTFSIPITDDTDGEGNETIILELSNPTNSATLGGIATMTITISDNDYTVGSIATATIDGNGDTRPDAMGSKMELTGIVYGVNLQPSGISMTIIDENDVDAGINVFKSSGNFGYTVAEGDKVTVRGTIGLYNGLTQIAADTLWQISAGNSLHPATVITALDETAESKLVRFERVWLTNVAQWPASGSNASVTVTDGTNNFVIRIDADTDIDGSTAPLATDTLQITGLGAQFDSSSPYDSGYQLNPRYLADIVVVGSTSTPTVGFEMATATVGEGSGNVTVSVTITNPDANDTSVDVVLGASSTATEGSDFALATTTTLTFPANSTTAQTFTIPLTDDDVVENSETIVLNLTNATNTASIGIGTMTITINDNDVNEYSIADVTADANNDFVPDSLNVACTVTGIIYGVNLQPSGISFTLIDRQDADAGVALFLNSGDLGFATINEGDEFRVQGTITQYNGLTEIVPTAMTLISTGNSLHNAASVTTLDENTESKLVKIANLRIVDPSQWPASGLNANVEMTDGTNTYVVRIDKDTEIDGSTAPTTDQIYEVTGIGGQFDNSDPRDGGYQLQPRYLADFNLTGTVATHDPKIGEQIKMSPNPATSVLRIESTLALDGIEVFNALGQRVMFVQSPDMNTTLAVGQLAQGMYFIKYTAANRYWTGRFTKR
jgi:plastocyanin